MALGRLWEKWALKTVGRGIYGYRGLPSLFAIIITIAITIPATIPLQILPDSVFLYLFAYGFGLAFTQSRQPQTAV